MPEVDDDESSGSSVKTTVKVKSPKTKKPKKAKKGRKGKKAKVKHAGHAGAFRDLYGAGTAAGHAPSASKETGAVIHPSGKGMAPMQLTPNADAPGAERSMAAAAGLGGIILDLVGEGTIRLSTALAAWARESERITNRSWRRPGGLSALGGL